MKIELLHTPGCKQCATAQEALRAIVKQTMPDAVWLDINVLEQLDYAVELGVLTLPAVAIDGKLVFTSLPTPAQLLQALQQHSGMTSDGS